LLQVIPQTRPPEAAHEGAYWGETVQLYHVSKDFLYNGGLEEAFGSSG